MKDEDEIYRSCKHRTNIVKPHKHRTTNEYRTAAQNDEWIDDEENTCRSSFSRKIEVPPPLQPDSGIVTPRWVRTNQRPAILSYVEEAD